MNTIEVSDHLCILGTEAKRLRARLCGALQAQRPAQGKLRRAPFNAFARRTARRTQRDLAAVEYLFAGPIARLGRRRPVRPAKVLRITRTLERVLDDLIGSWRGIEARTVDAGHDFEQQLLATGVRKSLEKVDDLLRRLVDRIDYPHLYLLPHLGPSDGAPSLLALSFDLRLPHELRAWVASGSTNASVAPAPARSGPDFWTLLGCLALGALLGQALWGGGDD